MHRLVAGYGDDLRAKRVPCNRRLLLRGWDLLAYAAIRLHALVAGGVDHMLAERLPAARGVLPRGRHLCCRCAALQRHIPGSRDELWLELLSATQHRLLLQQLDLPGDAGG
jgi:hypothetical protein